MARFYCKKCKGEYLTAPGQKPEYALNGIHVTHHEGAYCRECEQPMIQLPEEPHQ